MSWLAIFFDFRVTNLKRNVKNLSLQCTELAKLFIRKKRILQ
uniref:Uncharacterized protein n=1 Tax=Arundo donax TaxID=35708 RepID=A0A0A9FRB0_ARUDO